MSVIIPISKIKPLAIPANRLYNFSMSQSLNLYRLQQIDTQLDQSTQRLQVIHSLLADTTALQAVESRRNTSVAALQHEHKLLQQAENRVQDQKIKIEQTDAALYGGKVRNPKELQDLQNESAALRRYLDTLEDRQLEIMLKVEDLEGEAAGIQQEYDQFLAKTEEEHAQLRGEANRLEQIRQRLLIERQAAENAISNTDLAIYQQLREFRSGVAVVKIADRTCGACGASLTPALVQAANAPNQLARCASCGRILYPG